MTIKCKNCQQNFDITDKDQKFYQRINVPQPTLCPACRMQRRMAFRNERTLYENKCGLCGKKIIAMNPKSHPYTIYCAECWYSDKWDPLQYGQNYNFNRSFVEQFKELQLKVPRKNVGVMRSVNSEYTNMTGDIKDCYLIFAAENDENCLYGKLVQDCKDCVDCNFIYNSELCYQSNTCYYCFHCFYCQECHDCRDCFFSANLRGCHDCFLCTNLIHQKYYFLNKQYSEEEYKNKLREFIWGYENIQEKLKEFEKLKAERIVKYSNQIKCEACTGDYLTSCKRLTHCFDVTNGQDCAYLNDALDPRDTYDSAYIYYNPQLCYETMSTLNLYNVHFSVFCYDCSDLQYCDTIHGSKNCFASVGLQNHQYCIFNKQYSENEYFKLKEKIITQLKKEEIWGELLPYQLSCHPYNDTVAQDYFPLNQEGALKLGCQWNNEAAKEYQGSDGILASNLPTKIEEINDDILEKVIICERSKRGFKIIKQELDFYRKMNLPLPHLHPEVRHQERMKARNPRKLWNRKCDQCDEEIQTSYAPDRPEKVYCEKCYQKEIY